MLFLIVGVLGVLLKYLEVGFVAGLSWWIVLTPFALTLAWWAWADASGYSSRRAMERDERRKQARIDRTRSQLGMLNSRSGRGRKRG
ncbi:MAG: TIGR04438 family Trp-rich protein [Comamonadaceae bacterium]|nr:MAG: TIGR04438 family Trp-rich protein [Comamonadaceae bacterium]